MPQILDNCRLEMEDREFLASLEDIPKAFQTFARPESVGVEWHKTENQGSIGSCQGNDLASCVERVVWVAKQDKVQLSRIYAYLRTQVLDGLIGSDRGSTISGGGKVALEGLPLEELTGYPRSYPGSSERNRILNVGQLNYKATSLWKVPEDPDEARNWIGGGGAISIGIRWMGIPSDRILRSYNGGRGGHANAVLGYTPEYLIAVNSWGDGPWYITDNAWRQMYRDSYTAMVGIAGDAEPEPKPVHIHLDW